MTSIKEIKSLRKGVIPPSLEGTPFIIMRERVSFRFTGTVSWQYSLVSSLQTKDTTIISREYALDIVKANMMEEAIHNEYGNIWELPGCPFHAMYGNKKTSKGKNVRIPASKVKPAPSTISA